MRALLCGRLCVEIILAATITSVATASITAIAAATIRSVTVGSIGITSATCTLGFVTRIFVYAIHFLSARIKRILFIAGCGIRTSITWTHFIQLLFFVPLLGLV